MKTKRTVTVDPIDYTSMTEWLNRKGYEFNVAWDMEHEHFIFDYISDENYYIACMNDLADLRNSTLLFCENSAFG